MTFMRESKIVSLGGVREKLHLQATTEDNVHITHRSKRTKTDVNREYAMITRGSIWTMTTPFVRICKNMSNPFEANGRLGAGESNQVT